MRITFTFATFADVFLAIFLFCSSIYGIVEIGIKFAMEKDILPLIFISSFSLVITILIRLKTTF